MIDILHGDCLTVLKTLPDASVNCCVTSPPYWGLRDYGVSGQIGLEATPDAYVGKMVDVFREVRRVLREDGTLWLNLGDSYGNPSAGRNDGNHRADGRAGGMSYKAVGTKKFTANTLKPKDLVGIPWRVAFALRDDGWYLRSDIIWSKPNPMPESVTDRPTKAHEYIFLMSKSERYYYDREAIAEAALEESAQRYEYAFSGRPDGAVVCPGDEDGQRYAPKGMRPYSGKRNRRTVWTITTQPYPDAHFATFPPKLIEPCILAGCPPGGTVLDPFAGSGTTLYVAKELNRNAIGIELNANYIKLAEKRLAQEVLPLYHKEA